MSHARPVPMPCFPRRRDAPAACLSIPVAPVSGRFVLCFAKAMDNNDVPHFFQPISGMTVARPSFQLFLLSAHSSFSPTKNASVLPSIFCQCGICRSSLPCSGLVALSTGIRPIIKSCPIVKKKVSIHSIFYICTIFVTKALRPAVIRTPVSLVTFAPNGPSLPALQTVIRSRRDNRTTA